MTPKLRQPTLIHRSQAALKFILFFIHKKQKCIMNRALNFIASPKQILMILQCTNKSEKIVFLFVFLALYKRNGRRHIWPSINSAILHNLILQQSRRVLDSNTKKKSFKLNRLMLRIMSSNKEREPFLQLIAWTDLFALWCAKAGLKCNFQLFGEG